MRALSRWIICSLLVLLLWSAGAVSAQDDSGVPVHFAGHVQKVSGGAITINQIVIKVNDAAAFRVGEAVVVDGRLHSDRTLEAQTVSIYVPPVVTLQPIENVSFSGEVQAINRNVLTVNGQTVVVAQPDNLVLSTLQTGDQVDITGQRVGGGYVVALTITKIEAASAVVTIEGTVQAVHKNTITIDGQEVRFSPDDPLLHTLKVGDVLHVAGISTQTADKQVIQATSATVISQSDNSQSGPGKGMGK